MVFSAFSPEPISTLSESAIASFQLKKAVYPGTFDPFTCGHLDLVTRTLDMYPHVIVAVASNEEKKPLFSLQERLNLVQTALKAHLRPDQYERVEVVDFQGLLVDMVQACGASVIVRGLRAISDFEYEFRMAQMNKRLAPSVETVFMMASLEYQFLNATVVKQVACLGGDVTELVPECVLEALKHACP
ncbi:MAG: pantetheine-phosphate adenylyltransferase, partial [Vampirovibrionales bacterium]